LPKTPIAIFSPEVISEFKDIAGKYIEKGEECSLGSEVFPVLQKKLENNEINEHTAASTLQQCRSKPVEAEES